MVSLRTTAALLATAAIAVGATPARAATPAAAAGTLYREHCAACHGARRLGDVGPPLLPGSLTRLSRARAAQTIARGRVGTGMPAFGHTLSADQIRSLTALIYTPPARAPRWGMRRIRASHRLYFAPGSLPARPVYRADPLNLFVVVESGCHRVAIVDGDPPYTILTRFPSHFSLHGGPKFSRHGRYVYFASRDGWVTKYDLHRLKVVADVRAGINTRNIALSSDDRYVLVGNYLPHDLVVLDARTLEPLRIVPAVSESGRSSRISAVYDARPRGAFIAALKDAREVWEIPYRDRDLARHLSIRRIRLSAYPDDFFLDPSYRYLIYSARSSDHVEVVDLDSGRAVARIPMPGMPHLGSAITWDYRGDPVFASPNIKTGLVTVVDMRTWKVVRHIRTLGPGYFIRSHQATPYAWVDIVFGPNRDAVQVIDKRTLKIVRTLRPEPGHTSMHIEFDRYGRHAWVSIWERKGAVVIYDARTFRVVKRIPMCKPVGKYNVYNKITLSPGTSH